ncbi:hypothetical protein [Evansella tamaricis]|uniref:Uncharacterized protein n=1 Tax=Evansella tamaricis TaxID=2069301 RepID=A0ABS6JJ65_9BACI|nr:hypothetical protein [Evansella tamaricis]MBU9713430.1 hypothetical protein [Evansella tamaricis]
MPSMYFFGAILTIFYLLVAMFTNSITVNWWVKYLCPLGILLIGILLVPISLTVTTGASVFLAGLGITMIITSLVAIPIITLLFDKVHYRNKWNRMKVN